jgi:Tfp pilus assembly protein PilO
MQRIISILIIVSIADLTLLGGLWYGFTSMQGMKSAQEKLRSQIALESQKSERLAAQGRMLTSAENARARMSRFFYEQDEVSQIRFVSEIENLGRVVPGLLLETKSFDFVVSAKNVFPSFRASFEVTGSWGSVFHFLRLIEEFPARVTVERLEAKRGSGGTTWNGTLTINLISLTTNN